MDVTAIDSHNARLCSTELVRLAYTGEITGIKRNPWLLPTDSDEFGNRWHDMCAPCAWLDDQQTRNDAQRIDESAIRTSAAA